jgi:5S rRNA maturation endonuclease (ribonuclease M5)
MTQREPVRDLVARVDLVALVTRYSGEGRSQGRTTTFRCPHPTHPDERPSFVVTTNANGRQLWRCFSQCDRFGDAIDLVAWLDDCTKAQAADKLRAFLGEPAATPPERSAPRRASAARRPAGSNPQPDHAFLSRYVHQRGWPTDIIERFGLTVVTDANGLKRVRHPFLVPDSGSGFRVAYWQDRGTRDASPRWLSPAGRSPVLYNLPSLTSSAIDAVVICEGPPDTITASVAVADAPSIACVGVPGVSAWRPEWAQSVADLRVVVAADPDDAGRKLEEAIRRTIPDAVTFVRLSHGDLTDTAKTLGLDAIRELLLTACAVKPHRPQRDPIELILAAFPGSQLIDDHTESTF